MNYRRICATDDGIPNVFELEDGLFVEEVGGPGCFALRLHFNEEMIYKWNEYLVPCVSFADEKCKDLIAFIKSTEKPDQYYGMSEEEYKKKIAWRDKCYVGYAKALQRAGGRKEVFKRISEESSMSLKAAIYGLALGDALGVPVEFRDREWLRRHPVSTMVGWGTHYQPAGTWSDDTSMALCLLASIAATDNNDSRPLEFGVDNPEIDLDDIMRRFVDWLENGKYTPHGTSFGCGGICGASIYRYLDGTPAAECGGTGERDNGNGSLMRILPLVFLLRREHSGWNGCWDDWFVAQPSMDLVSRVSGLTHAHPISVTACGIYLAVAERLITTRDIDMSVCAGVQGALKYYDEYGTRYKATADVLKVWDRIRDVEALKALPEDAIKSGGYVVNTLEAALWCLLNTSNYADCVLKAVNLGGDTDTTAAVAGGLAGIAYGFDSIPKEWISTLQGKQLIDSLCDACLKVV